MNPQIVTVNLIPGLSTPAVVRISQYDVERPITLRVLDGNKAAVFTDDCTATIEGTKPSGLGFSLLGTIAPGGMVSFTTSMTMTQECGMIPTEIRFSTNAYGSFPATDIGTANFILAVEPSPHPEGTTDGSQETMQSLETRLQGEIDALDSRIDAIEGDQSIIDDIDALDARVTALEQGGSGLSQTEKNLILTLFSKAAYAESDAETAYDQLEALWASSTKTITYNLSNVVSSNTQTSIESGQPYSTALAVGQGYTLNSVSVTMGGVDITSTAYSSGTITIPSVTGNIVITATAVLAAQSITATYTQSGTVYDTDSLDSLKADLVVTANYSGGTSETVPASSYTLSGTLTVGTSTITVSYAGLTATFTVTVSSNLIHAWDFTQSLNDTVGSVTVTLNGAARNSSGINFTAKNHKATMAGVLAPNIRIEVDITEIDTTTTGKNMRLAMFSSDSGLVYKNTDSKWEWYIGAWYAPTGGVAVSDKHIFDGKTLTIIIDENSIPTAYCGDTVVANNGASVSSFTDFIIGSGDYTPFNMVVTGARIYRGA